MNRATVRKLLVEAYRDGPSLESEAEIRDYVAQVVAKAFPGPDLSTSNGIAEWLHALAPSYPSVGWWVNGHKGWSVVTLVGGSDNDDDADRFASDLARAAREQSVYNAHDGFVPDQLTGRPAVLTIVLRTPDDDWCCTLDLSSFTGIVQQGDTP
jgi:hypothetical protein